MSAPKGNHNAAKGRRWRDALNHELALLEVEGKPVGSVVMGLRAIARVVVRDALAGDYQAISEIANRQDGKPAQAVMMAGEDGEPISAHTISDLELARRILFDLHEAERANANLPMVTNASLVPRGH